MDPHSDGEDSGREDDFAIKLVREMIMNYENGVHLNVEHREHFPEHFQRKTKTKRGSNAQKP